MTVFHTSKLMMSASGSAAQRREEDGDKFDVTEDEFNEFCEGNDEILLEVLSEQDVVGKEGVGGDLNLALLHPSLQAAVRYENTYRTEPTTKFYPDKVSEIIRTHLEQSLGEVTYDQRVCSKLACELSESIKDEVKQKLNLPRRKLVSFVTIGSRQGQGARMASRCVWNEKADRYASSSYKNSTLFAVGVVFAVFLE